MEYSVLEYVVDAKRVEVNHEQLQMMNNYTVEEEEQSRRIFIPIKTDNLNSSLLLVLFPQNWQLHHHH